jgi:NAD(P)-dependent dehydrogenase (short-subunit alcohol dehydrogenase family)
MTTTYVMTGATSGIGAKALARLAAEPDTRVLIGARNPDNATVPAGVDALPLDLSSLESVRAFATNVRASLDGAPIDRLILNAGINGSTAGARSADGFDLTFATNHLAHYLLARLLLDDIAENGRVIMTTSDTHDPKTIGIGPKTLDIDGWASGKTSTRLIYPASKLGNLMTAESIAALPETKDKGITAIAFNPGLTGDTGLNRSMPAAARLLMRALRPVLYLVSFLKPAVYVNTAGNAGSQLAGLADGTITPPAGRDYASIVRGVLTYPDPSQLAQDPQAIETMWTRSAELVGLDPHTSA